MAEPAPLLPAYLIAGTDRPKVRRAVVRLRQRVIDEAGSDLNVVLIDAEHDPVETFLDAAVSPGLTFGTRLLLVLNGHRWKAKARQAVVAYLQDPMPDTCVTVEGRRSPPRTRSTRRSTGSAACCSSTCPRSTRWRSG